MSPSLQRIELTPDPRDLRQMIPLFALPREPMVQLTGFPMPPPQSKAIANLPAGRGRFKTSFYRQFERDAAMWALAHATPLRQARAMIIQGCRGRVVLRVSYVLHFPHADVWTQRGEAKKMDATNRLKCLDDTLASLLGCDDRLFFDVSVAKRSSPATRHPHVDVRIELLNLDALPTS